MMTLMSQSSTMPIVDPNTSVIKEHNQIIEDVLKLQRFLGNMNYGDQFQRRHVKGQQNWDFEDKLTKTTFKPMLVGEITNTTYGTLLKGRGNYRAPKHMPVDIVTIRTH